MGSTQRLFETEVVRMVLKWLGSGVIYEVQAPGCVEGGDFIPCGDTAFLGQGLRTNAAGVSQLLEQKVFGCRRVVIVKDYHANQDEMHLDTFFNVISRNTAVLLESRLNANETSKLFLMCDVYEESSPGGAYQLVRADMPFTTTLRDVGFTNIVAVPKEDQMIYGCNFLTVRENDILLVRRDHGVSQRYREQLEKANIKFTEVEMSHITCEFGAAHCLTQVARRHSFTSPLFPNVAAFELRPQTSTSTGWN
jgi:arginine deiminase